MTKKLPKKVWASGVGQSPIVWFKKPRRYVLSERDGKSVYIPDSKVGTYSQKKASEHLWLNPELDKVSVQDQCIGFVSSNKKKVEKFMQASKKSMAPDSDYQCIYAPNMARRIRRAMKS